ncbi:MAG: DUF1289 domain-containing protein [Polaromonas sp.]
MELPGAPASRADAINLLAARARTVCAAGDIVPSPCISVCRISTDTGWCEGCFRTLGEISDWSRCSPDDQRRLWRTLEKRMAAVQP